MTSGTLQSTRFSTLFSVPFGTKATFALEMTVQLLSGQEDLCEVQSSVLDPVTIFMPYKPPEVESVNVRLVPGELTGQTIIP